MKDRFLLNNHRGTNFVYRSKNFLSYFEMKKFDLTYVRKDYMSRVRSNLKWDYYLRPLAIVVSLVMVFVVSSILFSIITCEIENANTLTIREQNTLNNRKVMKPVLTLGYRALKDNDYELAQLSFQEYLLCIPGEIDASYGLAKTLMARCELDRNYCNGAMEYLEYTKLLNTDLIAYTYDLRIDVLQNRLDNLPY